MPSTLSRRRFVLGAVSGGLVALGGCTSNPFASEKLAHYVEVSNSSDETHNVHVLVADASGETLFASLFRLRPGTWEEDTDPFLGTPRTVRVTVDGEPPQTYEWLSVNCERERGSRSAGGLQVDVGENGEVSRHVHCDTVTI